MNSSNTWKSSVHCLDCCSPDISMVFEVLGCNLLKLIIGSDYKGLPVRTVKWITKQVQYIMSRECLSRVYMCG